MKNWIALTLAFWIGMWLSFLMLFTVHGQGFGLDKQERKREYQKAREATPRNPIPLSVVYCESGGDLRAQNPTSSAGGRYQILTSTWAVSLPSNRFVQIAGGNKGPRWSSRLLQDRVAWNIVRRDGLGAWSCA